MISLGVFVLPFHEFWQKVWDSQVGDNWFISHSPKEVENNVFTASSFSKSWKYESVGTVDCHLLCGFASLEWGGEFGNIHFHIVFSRAVCFVVFSKATLSMIFGFGVNFLF